MSYTDYLNRLKINTPKILNTQMRFPDASAYTWRKKLESTRINRRTDHVINNSQDLGIAPRLFSPAVMGYGGSGFGGRVQDASSYTLSLSCGSICGDNFTNGQIVSNVRNTSGNCLTTTPASQVVSELGNADGDVVGLNMGYTRQRVGGNIIDNVGLCNSEFRPLTKSQFVDTIPDIKTHKIGVQTRVIYGSPVGAPAPSGSRQVVQNPITTCITTNTSGDIKGQEKSHQPFNSYSAVPKNVIGSRPYLVSSRVITGVLGPQVGGGTQNGQRATKVGGPVILVKNSLPHRSWGNAKSRIPYPYMGASGYQPAAPAQKTL
jgi:hypothetical protein